jgi:indolepyruvate ferredoxin oxidoreductase alpha subunit
LEDNPKPAIPLKLARQPYRFVPYPGNAVVMHRQLHQRLASFEKEMEEARWNQISGNGTKGVIAAGLAYQKLVDVVGDSLIEDLSILKLSTLYPLPKKIIGQFLDDCAEVLVLEESDAYVEEGIKTIAHDLGAGLKIIGKQSGHLPVGDELLRWQIQAALEEFLPGFKPARSYLEADQIAERPHKTNHCADSPNQHILALLKDVAAELDQDPILIADPGCWVKVAGELDGKFAIGSAVAVASGLDKSGVEERVVASFGDSAFFHMALPAICNAAYHRSNLFMLLLNNGGAMSTGKQPTPASGVGTLGAPAPLLNIIEIAQACGVTNAHHLPASASDEEIKDFIIGGLSDQNLCLLVLDVE